MTTPAGGTAQPLDGARLVARVTGAARLEPGVFAEVAGDPAATVSAAIVVAAVSLVAGVGAVLFEQVFGAGSMLANLTLSLVTRQLVVGPAVGIGGWLTWTVASIVLLKRLGVPADPERLARALGFASVPMALLGLMWLPDLLQGDRLVFGYLSAGVVATAAMLLALWGRTALREAVPAATERAATLASFGGYVVAMAIVSWLGFAAGVAPGISVFLSGDRFL